MVWEEAVRITMDLVDNIWKNRENVVLDNALDITLPVSYGNP